MPTTKIHSDKPDHAGSNSNGSFGYLDVFHVEEDRFEFVVSRLGQQRMKQDSTARVDEEGVRESAEMEVDDRTEHGVDWNVHTRDALELAVGDDRQARRRHHSYSTHSQRLDKQTDRVTTRHTCMITIAAAASRCNVTFV